MPDLIITKPFKFAHQGIHVEEFVPAAEPQLLTDECATVALAEGWAKRPRGRPPAAASGATPAAALAAPETAAFTDAPETKAGETDTPPADVGAETAQADLIPASVDTPQA